MTADANTAKAMLEDIIAWLPQLADTARMRATSLNSNAATPIRTAGHASCVERAHDVIGRYNQRLKPLADLAAEWATQRGDRITPNGHAAYLHAHAAWAARRPGFDIAAQTIAETHAWVADETGNGPEKTGRQCPACLAAGRTGNTLVRYPTENGYSRIMVCPACASMHTEASLSNAYTCLIDDNDIPMPAEWIRRHWNIKPSTWRKWKQRGKIAPNENGNYPLNLIRTLLDKANHA